MLNNKTASFQQHALHKVGAFPLNGKSVVVQQSRDCYCVRWKWKSELLSYAATISSST